MNSTGIVDDLNSTTSSAAPSNSSGQAAPLFVLPWWVQLLYFVFFVAMFVVAAGGNIIVIWIVLAHKRMRTVTNYFLVNLAVADVMISLLNTPFNFVFMLYQDWWFDRIYCKFCFFISPCAISASVLTFMAIAIDRNGINSSNSSSSRNRKSSSGQKFRRLLEEGTGKRPTKCKCVDLIDLQKKEEEVESEDLYRKLPRAR